MFAKMYSVLYDIFTVFTLDQCLLYLFYVYVDDDFCNSGEQTIMSVGSTVTDGSEQITSASDKTSSCELSSEFELIRTMSQSSDGSKVECGKGDVDLSSEWQTRSGSFVGQASAAAFGYKYFIFLF